LPNAHIVKLSEEELVFLTAIEDEQTAVQTLFQENISIIIITHGAKGASLYTAQQHFYVPATKVTTVDTTGAGDAFIGAMLSQFLAQQLTVATITAFCEQHAEALLSFANHYAGISTMKHGAIPSYPARHELSFR